MEDSRKLELFEDFLEYFSEHCEDNYSYAFTLYRIGFSEEEIREELIDGCGILENDVNRIMEELF